MVSGATGTCYLMILACILGGLPLPPSKYYRSPKPMRGSSRFNTPLQIFHISLASTGDGKCPTMTPPADVELLGADGVNIESSRSLQSPTEA